MSTALPPRTSPWLVVAAAATTVVLWAAAFIGIRFAGPHYSAGGLSFLRMLVGTGALAVIAWRRGLTLPPRRIVPGLIAWGVGWFCLYNLALNTAEHTIDAGTAAMLVNLAPLLVVLFSGLFGGEGFPRGLLIGAPISFAGVVLIATQSGGQHATLIGVLLGIASAVLYASCTLIQKRFLRSIGGTSLTFWGALAGTIALLPWAPDAARTAAHAPASAMVAVVLLGLLSTGIAFTTWAFVLARVSAGQTSSTTYAVPAVAIVLSWLLLGEAPTPMMLVGGVLCLLGVALTRLIKDRRAA